MAQILRPQHRFWTELAEQATAQINQRGVLYQNLQRRLANQPDGEGGVWSMLRQRADPAQYRPQRIEGVIEETLNEGGQQVTVLRSPSGHYLRLSAAEREIWQAMDGSRTIAQLATMGFLRFKQLLPIAGLVETLRAQGFLSDTPTGIYRRLRTQLEQRTAEGLGQRLLSLTHGRSFSFSGADTLFDTLYRWVGRWLFNRFFAGLLGIITVIGVICYFLPGVSGSDLISGEQFALDFLMLGIALFITLTLHEIAHGLAVKHFGRHVPRAGIMLYFGMPAAFVDTSDIWLAPRYARILVSLAGPLCDLLIGSIAAIIAWAAPDTMGGLWMRRIATASYLTALFNFNPLLELDGYFILVDALRLPNLRNRALAFIGGPFWQKLRAGTTLNREERIFAGYGLLSATYTGIAIVMATLFWQRQFASMASELWSGGWIGQLLAIGLFGLVIAPLMIGIALAGWGLVKATATWLARRGYARNPVIVASAFGMLALAVSLLPLRFGLSLETGVLLTALWVAAVIAQWYLQRDYEGAWIGRALASFLIISVIELIAQAGYLIAPDAARLWSGIEIVGYALLLFAGFVALLDVDLHQQRSSALIASALLLTLAFPAGAIAAEIIRVAHPEYSPLWALIAAVPIYSGVIGQALLLPLLISLRDARLFWSWLLLWFGILAQISSYLLELLPTWRNTPLTLTLLVLAAGLWAAAWATHLVTLRGISLSGLNWPLQPALGETVRLQDAFRHMYIGLYRLLRGNYGTQRTRALDNRMDVLAATANWEITFDRDQVRISPTVLALPLNVQAARYAEILRYAVATLEQLAGRTFTQRALLAAYDALPWPEREALDRHCLAQMPWAHDISRAFGDAREARVRLLRQIELFTTCDDQELHELAAAFIPQRVAAGELLLRAGEPPRGIWVIEAGEILERNGEVVRELHRGDYFGELQGQEVTDCEYRASIESDLLYLPSNELQRMLREAAPHTAEGAELLARMRLLERVPLLADVPRARLRELARSAEHITVAARQVIIRQGRPGGKLYVIVNGQAAVLRQEESEHGPKGPARLVARLGPAEFFGEMELLRGTLPIASVVAITPLELIAIPHQALVQLILGGDRLTRKLEQISSGRLLELRERAKA
ncbi:cyclic nucleotide-binding domain-containing protein [uncultured Chloroflexus sp.]|uniref:cyclic nucleotide-binding domain-containing protein n=1 Tax=uncultured Chloroflexus sp. TaxID=214040 RepID=UPI00261694BC|nr:cyclic nucleotide-binding domain-containing protein [uncultured Chloroflexus sp.]